MDACICKLKTAFSRFFARFKIRNKKRRAEKVTYEPSPSCCRCICLGSASGIWGRVPEYRLSDTHCSNLLEPKHETLVVHNKDRVHCSEAQTLKECLSTTFPYSNLRDDDSHGNFREVDCIRSSVRAVCICGQLLDTPRHAEVIEETGGGYSKRENARGRNSKREDTGVKDSKRENTGVKDSNREDARGGNSKKWNAVDVNCMGIASDKSCLGCPRSTVDLPASFSKLALARISPSSSILNLSVGRYIFDYAETGEAPQSPKSLSDRDSRGMLSCSNSLGGVVSSANLQNPADTQRNTPITLSPPSHATNDSALWESEVPHKRTTDKRGMYAISCSPGSTSHTCINHEVWDDDFDLPKDTSSLEIPHSVAQYQMRVLNNSANLKRFASMVDDLRGILQEFKKLSASLISTGPKQHFVILKKYSEAIMDAVRVIDMSDCPRGLNFDCKNLCPNELPCTSHPKDETKYKKIDTQGESESGGDVCRVVDREFSTRIDNRSMSNETSSYARVQRVRYVPTMDSNRAPYSDLTNNASGIHTNAESDSADSMSLGGREDSIHKDTCRVSRGKIDIPRDDTLKDKDPLSGLVSCVYRLKKTLGVCIQEMETELDRGRLYGISE